MKHVIAQVQFNGINFLRYDASTMLDCDARTKGRVAMAHTWVLGFSDEKERKILTHPSSKKLPGAVGYDAFKKEVEDVASTVVTKALIQLKDLQWEISTDLQKKNGRVAWDKSYKCTAAQLKCNTVVSVLEKRNAKQKKLITVNKPTINFFQKKMG